MFRNYFVIAFRNLWKHRLFSLINIFGLASGMMVCLLAIAHIKGAFDYDTFHPNRDRIYRVLTEVDDRRYGRNLFATSPMPLAETLKRDYAFVEETSRFVRTYGEFSANYKRFDLLSFAVDPGFFRMFGFPMAKGRPATEPGTAVLTRETAERFFGTADPIGQVIQYGSAGPLTVTGVLADSPVRSHLKFDILLALGTPTKAVFNGVFFDWRQYTNGYTYVLLRPGIPADALERVLPAVAGRATRGLKFQTERGYSFRTQALTDLSPAFRELMFSTYEPQVSGLLAELSVGLVTLLLAGFNYINLTLARSLGRAREVGIRKVAGALRIQVVAQFMAESTVLSLFALGLAYLMLELVKPMAFVQRWLIGGVEWDLTLWGIFIAFSILTGLLAGAVPARVLSGFEPAQVLRSKMGLKVMRGISLRKSLVVIQFAISIVAMISLMSMHQQMEYMATADYGFRREGILNIPVGPAPHQRLVDDLRQVAGVERVSAMSKLFGHHGDGFGAVRRQRTGGDSSQAFSFAVDPEFVPNFSLQLLAGRNLPPAAADSLRPGASGRFVLINEEAARAFRFPDARAAVGQTLWLNDSTEVQIIGVMKDFKFTSFAWAIKPLILRNRPDEFRFLNVRITPGSEETALADIRAIWKKHNPYEAFAGQWYDDFLYDHHTHPEDMNFMGLLIGLALSIAGLGLFGMVTYTTETRIREVGIRKVMGANVGQIVMLLSKDFVKLLALSGVIALPLGYMAGNLFLHAFAYHISIGAGILLSGVGVLLTLGALTIGIRTYRAAQANPADSLRAE
ncbi:ABC transporter permease [Larkinella soli]|uniref:ABC transporter permease n=1 Tax=Larkinella soli TaxID=1770527 RepID=UPI000FFC6961|nr:ABC transporter permease [Larkinella soli]